MISERDRDELRALMPVLLREKFGVTNLNRMFSCPSPAHEDSSPSARYYENGNTVHCFGCGNTWDVFSLMKEVDGVEGFAEQARAVAEIVGYRLEEEAPEKAKPETVREELEKRQEWLYRWIERKEISPDGGMYNPERNLLFYHDEGSGKWSVRHVEPAALCLEMLGNNGKLPRGMATVAPLAGFEIHGTLFEEIPDDPVFGDAIGMNKMEPMDGSRPVLEEYETVGRLRYNLGRGAWGPATLEGVLAHAGEVPEVTALVESPAEQDRIRAARMGLAPEVLSNDASARVRRAVAAAGYKPEILAGDRSGAVRAAVAATGYMPEKMAGDRDWHVRAAVARTGKCAEKLRHDKVAAVRYEVAAAGRFPLELCKDKDADVRQAVAERGYALDLLVDDVDLTVALAAEKAIRADMAKKARGRIEASAVMGAPITEVVKDWAQAYPKRCARPENRPLEVYVPKAVRSRQLKKEDAEQQKKKADWYKRCKKANQRRKEAAEEKGGKRPGGRRAAQKTAKKDEPIYVVGTRDGDLYFTSIEEMEEWRTSAEGQDVQKALDCWDDKPARHPRSFSEIKKSATRNVQVNNALHAPAKPTGLQQPSRQNGKEGPRSRS